MEPTALILTNDSAVDAPSIPDHLAGWAGADPHRRDLAQLVTIIADAAIPVAGRLALGSLPGDPSAIVGINDSGDRQKALDMAAHDHFVAALRRTSVRSVLSEETEGVIELDPAGRFNVAMDPIDGSGSIGIGAPLGMLFCVFPADNANALPT